MSLVKKVLVEAITRRRFELRRQGDISRWFCWILRRTAKRNHLLVVITALYLLNKI